MPLQKIIGVCPSYLFRLILMLKASVTERILFADIKLVADDIICDTS